MSEGCEFKLAALGSLPSFAAQCTNGRNADNQPFVMHALNVSVAGRSRRSIQLKLRPAKLSFGGSEFKST